jgi:hypothetical protein
MRATQMHDLLLECQKHLESNTYSKGKHEGFEHIEYCNFCHYSLPHIAANGHGKTCLLERLRHATANPGNGY